MFATPIRYRKCTYATCCPLQSPQLLSENPVTGNFAVVRYISEVDERLGVMVRLYAVVECPLKKISSDMLIEQIRTEFLPFDRTYGEHPINNIGNDAQLASLIGTTLASIHRRCAQICEGQKQNMPKVAIAIIRGQRILCGILGNMVFALLRKNADTYARRAGSQQYTLFSNCDVPLALGVSNFVNTSNSPVNLYVHQIESTDLRFFIFTMESVRMLLKAVPSLTLFTKSSDDITWSLYIWQTRMYSKNPNNVPAAGFLLVDNLPKLIMDTGTCLQQDFGENLLKLNEAKENQTNKRWQEQRQEEQKLLLMQKHDALSTGPEKQTLSKNQHIAYLETVLNQIREQYAKISELIGGLLRKERDEMMGYMKRDEQLLNIRKECGDEVMIKSRIEELQQQQKEELEQLRMILSKVLKYQNVVRYELLLNIEKMEQTLDMLKNECDAMVYARETYHHQNRMQRVTLFQTRIVENLDILEKQIKIAIENGSGVQSKLNTLGPQVLQPNRRYRPNPPQTFWKGGGGRPHYGHGALNQRTFYGGGGPYQWRRRPNGCMFWNNHYNK